jgi:rhodanese-related sulfurtransferase
MDNGQIFVLDVRDPSEFKKGHIDGAANIPLDDLRQRMEEVPKDREVWAYCFVGQRSYYAVRALSQYGYDIKNLSGGYMAYTMKAAPDSR